MKKILCWIKIVLGLSMFLALGSIIIYAIKFSDSSITQDTETWGAFGDYVGGLISAIIGIVNLFLLVAITVFVEKLNNHRHLNEFRYYALTELHNQFDNLEYTSKSLEAFRHQIDSFNPRNSFLFKNMEVQLASATKRLSDKLSSEIIIAKAYEAREKKGEAGEMDVSEFQLQTKPNDPMNDIKYLYDDLIALIQKQIVSTN